MMDLDPQGDAGLSVQVALCPFRVVIVLINSLQRTEREKRAGLRVSNS